LQLHISERTGRGVPKITEVYGKGTYEFRENSIVASIPFTRVETDGNTPVDTQVSTQVNTQVDSSHNVEDKILLYCENPKSTHEITDFLGYKNTKGVFRNYITPLVQQGRLAMTIPDKPNSSKQKYITIK
jgi:hypothetical protein